MRFYKKYLKNSKDCLCSDIGVGVQSFSFVLSDKAKALYSNTLGFLAGHFLTTYFNHRSPSSRLSRFQNGALDLSSSIKNRQASKAGAR